MRFDALPEIEERIRSMPGLRFRGTEAFLGREALLPSELIHVEKSVESRVRDFATGRWCARQALRDLGIPASPIGVGPGREPLWPEGVAGSISHTSGYCCAVVTRETPSVGIDVQAFAGGIREETWKLVCTPGEAEAMEAMGDLRPLVRFGVFSAKEAVYKLIFPEVRRFIDFQDVQVRFDPGSREVEAVLRKDLAPSLPAHTVFRGSLFFMRDRCLALFVR